MVNITNQVCSEVYDIIFHMENELFNKIPKSFINIIEQNRDEKYETKIDYSKSINDQELQRGTRVILSLIYRDYLCSEKQRKILIEKDEKELKKIEEELNEKCNPENLFKKHKELKDEEIENPKSMIIYKETIIQKIINKIKKWFHLY